MPMTIAGEREERLRNKVLLLEQINSVREETGDQGYASGIERAIVNFELSQLASEWLFDPETMRLALQVEEFNERASH